MTKRKYYDLIHNFPLFLPDEEMGNRFAALLDKYPVTPYLDKRDSLVRWVHFIHNKVNRVLEKPSPTFLEGLGMYEQSYIPMPLLQWDADENRRRLVWGSAVVILLMAAFSFS